LVRSYPKIFAEVNELSPKVDLRVLIVAHAGQRRIALATSLTSGVLMEAGAAKLGSRGCE